MIMKKIKYLAANCCNDYLVRVRKNLINIMINHQLVNKAKNQKVGKMIKKIHFIHCKREYQLTVQLTNLFRKYKRNKKVQRQLKARRS